MFSKNLKFPTVLFVVASLAIFLLFIFFYLMFHFLFLASNVETLNNQVKHNSNENNFLKSDISDPFITKKPGIKDLIKKPIINGEDPVLGAKEAKISLIIFSDFSCSFCARQEQILREILNKYKEQINLIRKDYPLDNLESESFRAARAARCAQEQNKFWDFHDLLFKYPEKRKENNFIDFAEMLALNKNIFVTCLKGQKASEKIENNILEANALDIYGIPFIYINDREIVGEINEEELSRMIELELGK